MSKLWQHQSYNSDTSYPTTYTQSYIFLHQSYNSLISPTTYTQPHINLTPSNIQFHCRPFHWIHITNRTQQISWKFTKSTQFKFPLNFISHCLKNPQIWQKFNHKLVLIQDTISSFLRLFINYFLSKAERWWSSRLVLRKVYVVGWFWSRPWAAATKTLIRNLFCPIKTEKFQFCSDFFFSTVYIDYHDIHDNQDFP